MVSFTPKVSDAYWIGQPDGQSSSILFGSARNGVVATPSTDTAYRAWLAQGYAAWPWPNDESGARTTAALDAILESYGLPPTGLTAPTQARLIDYAGARADALVTALRAIPADGATVKTDSGDATIVLLNAIAATLAGGATTIWTATDLSTVTVTGPQLSAAASAALAYRIAVYGAALPAVLAAIAGGTITTFAEIDSYSWPA